MNKAKKTVLAIATICLAAGVVISGVAFALAGFDVQRLSTSSPYTQQTFTSKPEGIEAIKVKGLSEDATIIPTKGDQIEVEYYINETQTYTIQEQNGTLEIIEERKLILSMFNFNFESHRLTIKIPESFIGKLDLGSTSGDISLSAVKLDSVKADLQSGNITCSDITINNAIEISVTSGSVNVSNIISKSLSIASFSGNVRARDLIESDQIEISATSGNIETESLQGQHISLSAMSGDITVHSLNAKSSEVNATSGNIYLQSLTANDTLLKAMSGNIKAFVTGKDSDYRITTSAMSGDIRTPSGNSAAEKSLTAETTSGNITFTFEVN